MLLDFPALDSLDLTKNCLYELDTPLPSEKLRVLNLSENQIGSLLEDLEPLTHLKHLENLSLRDSQLWDLSCTGGFETLQYLDLRGTNLLKLTSLNKISLTAPNLLSLSISTLNVSYSTHDERITRISAIICIPSLCEINYAQITPEERQSAEMDYLQSRVDGIKRTAKDFAHEMDRMIEKDPHWNRLCNIYGAPESLVAAEPQAQEGTLCARVTKITFYMHQDDLKAAQNLAPEYSSVKRPFQKTRKDKKIVEISHKIPRTVDIYGLKGICGRLFGIRPLSCKLIWETGERDPVSGKVEEEDGWSVS